MELAQKLARFSEIINRKRFSFEHSEVCPTDYYEYVAELSPQFRAFQLKPIWFEEFKNDMSEVEAKLGCKLPDDIKHFYQSWGCPSFNTWDSSYGMLSAFAMTDMGFLGAPAEFGRGKAFIIFMEIDGQCYFALRTRDFGENWDIVFLERSHEDPFGESAIVTDSGFYELLDRLDRTNGYPPVQSLPNAFTPNQSFADTLEELRNIPVLKAAMENGEDRLIVLSPRPSFTSQSNEMHSSDSNATSYPTPDHIAAHKRSSIHRAEVLASEICGCFHCRATFPPTEIEDWVDERPMGDGNSSHGETALCPKCGIDSVIGSASGFPITPDLLRRMNAHWF